MSRRFHNLDATTAQDRWIVSYADFITLLFAFFVVMYSISSINEGKYKMLSGSLSDAFDSEPAVAVENLAEHFYQFETGEDGEIVVEESLEAEDTSLSYEDLVGDQFSERALDRAEQEIDQLGSRVEQQMPELIDDGLVDVRRNKFWLEVEIKSNLLFTSGSSLLLEDATEILQELSRPFVGMPNRLNIEGFTDNRPISTSVYPSNWELSAARAATVVRLFEEEGIEPSRLASIGYGEHHPVASNDTLEGRARNRRVVIIVMADMEESPDQRLYALDFNSLE